MNIEIRDITIDDTNNIIKWRNNPHVLEYFIDQTILTPKMHMDWYNSKIKTGDVVQMIISDTQSKIDIGSVYLRDVDPLHQKAEFGIFIGEDSYRGKGCGRIAAKLMVDYGFRKLNLHKIYLRVLSNNLSAIKSYCSIGFTNVGLFKDDVKINGHFRDVLFMELIKASEGLLNNANCSN